MDGSVNQMDNIERQPIQVPLSVELVPPELELSDFIPKHQYKFNNAKVSEESLEMYESLKSFLELNQELITSQNFSDPEEYAKGFRQAIAICGLWTDSIYKEREGSNNG